MAKKKPTKDPFASREAGKYERPIASRELILEELAHYGSPLSFVQLAERLEIADDIDLESLRRRMIAMCRDGQLIRNRRGDFCLIDKLDLVQGRVVGHPDGFGFLVKEEGGEDLFIPPKQMKTVLHGDEVMVRVCGKDRRGRSDVAIVEVLKRANESVVGRFILEGEIAVVEPSNKRINQDIIIPAENRGSATNGQVVVVAITQQPMKRSQPLGKVIEVLGDHLSPGMEIDVAVRAFGLPSEWPKDVLTQIKSIAPEVKETDIEGRIDLRKLPLVTIDGEDARDFDDAVYCEPSGKGWRLVVAIADVSSYVTPKSALDDEAFNRGNSVYFPGEVIPMLPEVLSNGLCSLNPNVNRLCMVCELQLTASGAVKSSRFYQAVMRSHARLTYTKVGQMIEGFKSGESTDESELTPHIKNLFSLYQVLTKQRVKRGTIDFDTTETQIIFDDQRKIEKIIPAARNDAHRLIEEFMILANVASAEFILKNERPCLYRNHNDPKESKLEDLREFLKDIGLTLGGGDTPEPKDYSKLLRLVKGRKDAHLIQTVLLRSLSQASYQPENSGHFGLAFDAYTHFTSPIRRYPDLMVHRTINSIIYKEKRSPYSVEQMLVVGEHCSLTERRADEAAYDAIAFLKCEYMSDRVGETFDGVIMGVTGFGIFVELNDIYVEGMVHITSLPKDYYHYDAVKHCLKGENSARIFRLADSVRVRVMHVNLDEKKIDLEIATDTKKPYKKKK